MRLLCLSKLPKSERYKANFEVENDTCQFQSLVPKPFSANNLVTEVCCIKIQLFFYPQIGWYWILPNEFAIE